MKFYILKEKKDSKKSKKCPGKLLTYGKHLTFGKPKKKKSKKQTEYYIIF